MPGLPPPLSGLPELPPKAPRPAGARPGRAGKNPPGPAFAVPPHEAGPRARPSPHGGGGETGAGPGRASRRRDGNGGGGRRGREGRARGRREAGGRRPPGGRSRRRRPLRAALVSGGGGAACAGAEAGWGGKRLQAREPGRPLSACEMGRGWGECGKGRGPLVQSVVGAGLTVAWPMGRAGGGARRWREGGGSRRAVGPVSPRRLRSGGCVGRALPPSAGRPRPHPYPHPHPGRLRAFPPYPPGCRSWV